MLRLTSRAGHLRACGANARGGEGGGVHVPAELRRVSVQAGAGGGGWRGDDDGSRVDAVSRVRGNPVTARLQADSDPPPVFCTVVPEDAVTPPAKSTPVCATIILPARCQRERSGPPSGTAVSGRNLFRRLRLLARKREGPCRATRMWQLRCPLLCRGQGVAAGHGVWEGTVNGAACRCLPVKCVRRCVGCETNACEWGETGTVVMTTGWRAGGGREMGARSAARARQPRRAPILASRHQQNTPRQGVKGDVDSFSSACVGVPAPRQAKFGLSHQVHVGVTSFDLLHLPYLVTAQRFPDQLFGR